MCPHEVENCVLHFASVPRMVGISSYAPASAFSNRQEVKMGTSETGVLAGFLVSPNSHRQWCIWDPFLWHFWWWKWWSTIGQNWLPWDSWFWEAWEHVWKHMLVMILFPCHLAFVLLRMGVTVRGVSPIPGWTSGSCTGPSPAALSQRLRSICTGSGGWLTTVTEKVTLAEELDLWGPGVRIPVDYQCVSRGFKHPADLSSFFLSVLVIDKYLVCRLCSGFSRLKMPPTSLCIPGAMQCGPDPKGVSAGQTLVPLSELWDGHSCK